ncbi:Scr1 family TA system antitoxin-like transcriptional regulator [Streptomyces gamaensis]|uniref:Scr1 family TA system antitoxin-like transcriptional regulator n=1 Tax=Streptomyces gamaensis TaxID=1763542 RepID=A0ABW0Z533_9ACTN
MVAAVPAPQRREPSKAFVTEFCVLLRTLRVDRGWTQKRLGEEVHLCHTVICRYESGDLIPNEKVVRDLDEALKADGSLTEAWDRLNDTPQARWVQRYFKFESRATAIRHCADFVPGVLQTREFAREVLRRGVEFYGGDLEEKVEYRMLRASLLLREGAPTFSAFVEEQALHVTFDDPDIMRGQLSHLLAMSEKPNIRIRVVPFDRKGMFVSVPCLTILTSPDGRDVVHLAGPLRDQYITKEQEVQEYIALCDHQRDQALTESESISLMRNLLEERYPCP